MKKCSKCCIEKELNEFNKNSARGDGYHHYCKLCQKEANKLYINKENRTIYIKLWKQKNKDKINNYATRNREKNLHKEKFCRLEKRCYMCLKDKLINEFVKDKYSIDGYTYDCKGCRKEKSKLYRQSQHGREMIRKRDRLNYKKNPLPHNISRAIQIALKKNNGSKNNLSVWSKLTYTPQQLKEHLESQFELWMNWDNYGALFSFKKTWNVDHIIPQSKLLYSSMDDKNFQKCWDLNNLRPLEASLNTKKGDKIYLK